MSKGSKFRAFLKANIMWAILILLIVVFSLLSEHFFSWRNLMNICTQNSYFLIAALGVGMIMISGGTDLAAGQCMSVVGVMVAMSMKNWGLPIVVAILIGIVAGIVLGMFNGYAANLLKIHPMIVTLATMTMFQGISYTISGSKSFFNFDPAYKFIGQGYVGKVSFPVIIALVLAIIVHFVLEKTCFGRFVYAAGGNAEAARLAGINVKRIKVIVFAIAGALYAIAAVVLTSRSGSANSGMGPGTEFDSITACVLGGISFIGGEGKVKGIIVGVLILGVLSNGMQLIGMGVYSQYIVKGIILMLSIGYDTIQKTARVKKATTEKTEAAA